ncbi:binding-protein-dependent transport systems inner membrane component [Thermobaculum terrenum ATCC BAA-798]|uniref:Binding-protein-dependent transport systems inner membrane component n=1 Tax=Thermobaculum terrenum (strain ATCC BAA-798 / CCMEE 7001 / YNP1) TaxID=525904 RepID=D1CIG3_THET1|nr:carbohydrate ABC transporter permease [Thermobaculum terrenum]ACZ43534.1 binding-protein-dependent transport systems inner membrane component [Thermobaculum terrenum ATCC BAA-798]
MAKRYFTSSIIHILLLLGVVISIFPFYWLVVMSTNTTGDIFRYPPKLTFGDQLVTNVQHVFQSINFLDSFINTLIVSVVTTILLLVFDSLAGFTFAKFDFPGKNILFLILLATFMVPGQLSTVPMFAIMATLGWVGSLKALIIPGAANAFGIFWIRQYAQEAVHDELLEAGRLDGCGHFRLWWHVGLPALRPALAFLGIFSFIYTWNDYFWPLVVLINPEHITLQVALSQLNGIYNTDYSMVMAGTLLATLPLIVIFLLGSQQFISDLTAGAVRE